MPGTDWLPSEARWIEQLAERIFSGEVLLIRALPRWGMSSVCEAVMSHLGECAVYVAGRSISEQAQRSVREKIDSDVGAKVSGSGYAQLIFDDYGHALRRSQGGALHSMLYRLLVDSDQARDTGALLVARTGDMLDIKFRGSPLLSRATAVPLPLLQTDDASSLGFELSALQELAGKSTWLARRFIGKDVREGRISSVGHLNGDRRRIAEALPTGAVEVLLGACLYGDIDPVSQDALLCLGSVGIDSRFSISDLVGSSDLLDEVRVQSPGWPSNRSDSVLHFASLLAGAEDAIWVDRYALHQPKQVRRFIDDLRRHTLTRLRILISRDRDRPSLAEDIRDTLDGSLAVEVRFMSLNDRPRLHDRHLVLPATHNGFVLPTAGVIVGLDDPGSAVSVPIKRLAVNYAECWARAEQVFRSSAEPEPLGTTAGAESA